MSSWKKAAKAGQRLHKERHQPESRKSLGFLEKKKDYKLRANDHNRKTLAIKKLRKKALNKNPDEFYFHMINSVTEDGVHHEIEKDDEHTPEQLKLMETQDLRYVTMKRTMEAKKIETLKSQLHLLDAANATPNKHTFFVDSKKDLKDFDVAERLDTHPSLLGNRINRLRIKDLEEKNIETVDKSVMKKLVEQKKKTYKELSKRIERERELGVVQQKLEMKRHLAAGGQNAPKKVRKGTKTQAPVYKWNFERKR